LAGCRKILTDFNDHDGRALDEQLMTLAVDLEQYLRLVIFIDERRHPRCAGGVLALTAPGSRVVRVCGDEFERIQQTKPDYIVAVIIHEILHTLGLGEEPPSSEEITARVLARCGNL
jgi:hypothetical protein